MLRACHQEKNHYWMILNQNSEHIGGGYVFSICSNPAGVKYTENCPLMLPHSTHSELLPISAWLLRVLCEHLKASDIIYSQQVEDDSLLSADRILKWLKGQAEICHSTSVKLTPAHQLTKVCLYSIFQADQYSSKLFTDDNKTIKRHNKS